MSDRPNGHKTFDELWGKAALENHLKEHGWKYAAPEQQTLCEGLAFVIERYRKRIPLLIWGGILFGNFNAILAYPLYFILNEFVVAGFDIKIHEFLGSVLSFHKSLWDKDNPPLAALGYSAGVFSDIAEITEYAEKAMYEDKQKFYDNFPQMRR